MPAIRESNPTLTDSLAVIAVGGDGHGLPDRHCAPPSQPVGDSTRGSYTGTLEQLDAWLHGRRLDDAAVAAYLAELRAVRRGSFGALGAQEDP